MSKTLGSIIEGFKDSPLSAVELIPELLSTLAGAGFQLDLGPMTPDVRRRFDEIAQQERDLLRRKFERDGNG
jgi:hypothetical protein